MNICKNKKIYLFISIFFIIISMFLYFKVQAYQINWTEDFPESYKPYIEELSKKHSNWRFIPLYTNLDWNYVIQEENKFGNNLVPKNYGDSWKNTTPGQYNVEVDAGWVDSSRQAVEYCMDPRNFLNEVRLFQFEELSYDETTNNLDGIEKILYGTEFYKTKVNYLDSYGNNISTNETYGDLILKGAQTSYVSAYHLASRIKQEVGPFLTHGSISGAVEGFKGLYNFYNIGATSSAEPMGAIKNGLQYAKDGKGASQAIKNKYLIPWNTKQRAISGGGIFIGASYINVGQNTIYLQKFDVTDTTGDGLFWHQYMTNVLAPYSESKSIYNGYKQSGILETPISFIIPIYNNMPEIPTESPNINKNNFSDDNTGVYCNATNVNIRTGPSTSYEIITTVTKDDKMTRIKKGAQSVGWDKVKLENGIIGYIYQTYVTEIPPTPPEPEKIAVTGITIDPKEIYMLVGDTVKINCNIEPENATDKTIIYESTDNQIATIEENGIITANNEGLVTIIAKSNDNPNIKEQCIINVIKKPENNEIIFDESLTVNGLEISGIDYTQNTVSYIEQLITTNYEIEILNNKNEQLKSTDLIGTGSKIRFKDNGEIISEFKIILYGDVDGDGKISSVDLLVLQRHILEIQELGEIYKKAANINRNPKGPSSVDLLLIQRHILKLQTIIQ